MLVRLLGALVVTAGLAVAFGAVAAAAGCVGVAPPAGNGSDCGRVSYAQDDGSLNADGPVVYDEARGESGVSISTAPGSATERSGDGASGSAPEADAAQAVRTASEPAATREDETAAASAGDAAAVDSAEGETAAAGDATAVDVDDEEAPAPVSAAPAGRAPAAPAVPASLPRTGVGFVEDRSDALAVVAAALAVALAIGSRAAADRGHRTT